jgi:hypothetical protein
LRVSVDFLLDEAETPDEPVIRELYNLAAYGYGCSKVKKDRVVRDKFPNATIYPLLGRQDVTNLELHMDTAPDCRSNPLDRVKNTDKAFYLIEKDDQKLLVMVTDTFLEIRPLQQPVEGGSFRFGEWDFVKCNYELGK